jgi:hypothetical protein
MQHGVAAGVRRGCDGGMLRVHVEREVALFAAAMHILSILYTYPYARAHTQCTKKKDEFFKCCQSLEAKQSPPRLGVKNDAATRVESRVVIFAMDYSFCLPPTHHHLEQKRREERIRW